MRNHHGDVSKILQCVNGGQGPGETCTAEYNMWRQPAAALAKHRKWLAAAIGEKAVRRSDFFMNVSNAIRQYLRFFKIVCRNSLHRASTENSNYV
jgi:hypothetical protein